MSNCEKRGDAVLRYVAVHEAGHATASWAMQAWLGRHWMQFQEIVVRTPNEFLLQPTITSRHGERFPAVGFMEQSDRYTIGGSRVIATQFPKHADEVRRRLEADVVDMLAGPIAEARYRHCSLFAVLLDSRDDWLEARYKVADYCQGDQREISQLLNEFEARARKTVREHWGRINRLADALQLAHRLDSDQAESIIEK